MIDWSQLRDLIWEARWETLSMIGQALWINVLTHWWFGLLLLLALLTLTRRGWFRLIRLVGIAFLRRDGGD